MDEANNLSSSSSVDATGTTMKSDELLVVFEPNYIEKLNKLEDRLTELRKLNVDAKRRLLGFNHVHTKLLQSLSTAENISPAQQRLQQEREAFDKHLQQYLDSKDKAEKFEADFLFDNYIHLRLKKRLSATADKDTEKVHSSAPFGRKRPKISAEQLAGNLALFSSIEASENLGSMQGNWQILLRETKLRVNDCDRRLQCQQIDDAYICPTISKTNLETIYEKQLLCKLRSDIETSLQHCEETLRSPSS